MGEKSKSEKTSETGVCGARQANMEPTCEDERRTSESWWGVIGVEDKFQGAFHVPIDGKYREHPSTAFCRISGECQKACKKLSNGPDLTNFS